MKVVHLKDEAIIYDGDLPEAEIVVTYYEEGDYYGSGEALVYRDGKVEYHDLGHCSCFGPWEDSSWASKTVNTMTLEEFKAQNEQASCNWSDATAEKLLKLLLLPGDQDGLN